MGAPETKTFTLAMAQMRVEGGDRDRNLARADSMIQEAAAEGASIIVLPEALDCGWCDESAREHAGPIDENPSGPPGHTAFEILAEAARQSRLTVCAGLVERDGDDLYNTVVLIGPDGRLLLKHRKVNELAIAKHLYKTGKSAQAVCDHAGTRLGVLICSDAFFPGEALTRSLAAKGAKVILSPCAWAVPPDHDQTREPYGSLWRDVYGRVAKEHRLWICGTSNVGVIRHGAWAGHRCIGCSMLVGPDGEVHASGPYGPEAEDLIFHEIAELSLDDEGPWGTKH